MRKYLYSETGGFVEKNNWLPNCWVNVECPTDDDFKFLREDLKVPTSFLNDIADTDERPRTDTEGNWLLTILRIPVQTPNQKVPYTTVPIGIITNNEIIVSICYHSTEMIPDFIQHICRKSINIPNKYELILRIIYSSAVWFLKCFFIDLPIGHGFHHFPQNKMVLTEHTKNLYTTINKLRK